MTLQPSRTVPHYVGTQLSLTCAVEYNREIVDTRVFFSIDINNDLNNTRVSTNVMGSVGTALFSPLLPSDDASAYSCFSSILPVRETLFVKTVANSPSDSITFTLTGSIILWLLM